MSHDGARPVERNPVSSDPQHRDRDRANSRDPFGEWTDTGDQLLIRELVGARRRGSDETGNAYAPLDELLTITVAESVRRIDHVIRNPSGKERRIEPIPPPPEVRLDRNRVQSGIDPYKEQPNIGAKQIRD